MASRRSRVAWTGSVTLGGVGFLVAFLGLVETYPPVDFGTTSEALDRQHGQHVLEVAVLVLVLAAASLLAARCRGSAAATAGAALCTVGLAASANAHRNVTALALGLLAGVVAAAVLAVRQRPLSAR